MTTSPVSYRSLVELAAAAAGHGLPGAEDADPCGRQWSEALGLWTRFPWGWGWWAPHCNDGDALRLASHLRIDILHDSGSVSANTPGIACWATLAADPAGAWRSAILRAAAREALANLPDGTRANL